MSSSPGRAAAGGGPTLIEALTYRMEAHTNADDATRYRTSAEVSAWLERDPITRLDTYLRANGLLDDAVADWSAATGSAAYEPFLAAQAQAIVHNARQYLPAAELFCICSKPDDTHQRHGLVSFPMSRAR